MFKTAHLVYTEALKRPWGSPVLLTLPPPHSFYLCSSLHSPFHQGFFSFATSIFITSPYLTAPLPLSWLKNALVSCHSIQIMRYGTLQGVAGTQDLIPNLLSTTPTPGHRRREWEGDGPCWTWAKWFMYPWCIGGWISWNGFVLMTDKHLMVLEESSEPSLLVFLLFLVIYTPLSDFSSCPIWLESIRRASAGCYSTISAQHMKAQSPFISSSQEE